MAIVFSMSNLSLSNLLVSTGVDVIVPFSASNLYRASNVSVPPTQNTALKIGHFRGLTLSTQAQSTSAAVINCDPTTVTLATATAVSAWSVFGQTNSASRPVYNSTGGPSNKPYVAFNSTATINNTSGITFNSGTNGGLTMVIYVRFTTTGAGRFFQLQGGSTTANQGYIAVDQSSSTNLDLYSTTGPGYAAMWSTGLNTIANTSEWAVRVLRFTNTSASSCKCEYFKFTTTTTNPLTNNAQYVTFTQSANRFNNQTWNQNYLGGVGIGYANAQCHVHTFKVWDRSLPDAELQTTVNSLFA